MSIDTPYLHYSKSWQNNEDRKEREEYIAKLKLELQAACEHVERLCRERTLLRIVKDRAREFECITSTSNRIALVDALKELDGNQ